VHERITVVTQLADAVGDGHGGDRPR